MLISIIIPVYNVEFYIHKCVNSILDQECNEIEIILVNDGSFDNCPAICDEYANKNKNISVIHQVNGGMSNARNSGLLKAKGDFIWFIDSDDWIEVNALTIIINELKREDIEMLAFSFAKFYEIENGFSEPYNLKQINTTDGVSYLLKNGLMNPFAWTYIYKSAFLKSNNLIFKEGMIHEDDHFNLQCFALVKKIKKIPFSFYFYRIRENSIMSSKVSKKRLNSYLELLKLLKFLKKSSNLSKMFIDAKIFNYISVLFSLIYEINLEKVELNEYMANVKKIIPIQNIKLSDKKGIIFEKSIYNINSKLYYVLKKTKRNN